MKSILLSIKPKWVAKILNGEKTIEVRKKFPKDFKGWVYIYCTKDSKEELCFVPATEMFYSYDKNTFYTQQLEKMGFTFNGKVIARFYCDKVEEIKLPYTKFETNEWVGCEKERTLQTQTMNEKTLLEKSCLKEDEIYGYLNFKNSPNNVGYAIHISDLEIVNKELHEFKIYCSKLYSIWAGKCDRCRRVHIDYEGYLNRCDRRLTKAPQNYMFIEGND